MHFEQHIIKLLEAKGLIGPLETPPNPSLGDYAFPCFTLAKERKKAPPLIAQELAQEFEAEFIEKVVATGPYINFFIKPSAKAHAVLDKIYQGHTWSSKGKKRILIEYPSPNTNKPLHLGHVRNMVLGSTLVKILRRDGNTVIPINLNNDRGVHICKSMLAYQRWGNNSQPDKKSDHFVGDYYVRFQKELDHDPTLDAAAQEMLQAWEAGDPKVRALWSLMNNWALEGHKQTYLKFGITFDKQFYESDIYLDGKEMVLQHLDVLQKDDKGAIFAPLEQYKLPNKYLLRADGTTVYITQDLAFTLKKAEEFKPDLQIWVVGNEQNLHFQQLFQILESFGYKGRESYLHFSYGMISLPDGRMKSREGTVVDADDVIEEVDSLAQAEIRARHPEWDDTRVKEISSIITMGAIRFFIIKYDPSRDFVYDAKTSLSFEGDTGPYLQYTHARICSIFAKAVLPDKADVGVLVEPEEQELLRQLSIIPIAFRKSADELKPSTLATQLLEVARAFNSFYHACSVLNASEDIKNARLQLLEATRRVLNEGLELLGIIAPKEM